MTAMADLITRIVTQHGKLDEFNNPPEGEFAIKVKNPPYMALTIEKLFGPDHGCVIVSVCHYYEQQGDLMRDPEMCFDARDWQPLYFRNDGAGIEQYVYTGTDRKQYRPRLKRELTSFARLWAKNLHDQGFDNQERCHVETD